MNSASPFVIKLVQNSFTSGALLVSLENKLGNPITCQTYDIRVVTDTFSNIGTDAIATVSVINNFTITATPVSLPVPINADAMINGAKYTVIIRVHSTSLSPNPLSYTVADKLYYDARVYTISPVSVSSKPTGDNSSFDITKVVVNRDSNPLLGTDPFFSAVGVSNVVMSCTTIDVSNNKFQTGTDYYLGDASFNFDASYNFGIVGGMKDSLIPLVDKPASAYELWGYLSLAPQFTFGINIVANDATVGYVVDNPDIAINLGDVIGTVSEYPIEITLNNWNHYKDSDYMFTSLALEIYDASGTLLKRTDASGNYTKVPTAFELVNSKRVIKFTSGELSNETNETPLMNGVDYTFKTILHFNNDSLYKPEFSRYATKVGQFSDTILPIVTGSAVNSWEKDTNQVDGLVVEFKKTDQFYGSSPRPYNLESNTKVKAEYRIFNTAGNNWLDWKLLTGGSISQTSITYNYAVNNNTDGVYSVPVYNAEVKRGDSQDPVYIYTKIDGAQAKYSAVQIRLSLITTNAAFRSDSRISALYEVPRVAGTTYTATTDTTDNNAVTFRYHPKPVAHDFATDKPICMTVPNAFYLRTGGSNWRDLIGTTDTTTNLAWWNPDMQFRDVNTAPNNEIAKQFSYFAGYWLNRNRASNGQSYSVLAFTVNGSIGTFTFTAKTNYPVTAYTGHLPNVYPSALSLTPQTDGITAGQNAVGIAFDVPLTVPPFYKAVVTTSDGDCSGNVVTNITNPNIYDASWNLPLARTGSGLSYTPVANTTFKLNVKYVSIENPFATSESEVRSMTVQRQGFPSNSFSITKCRWDYPTQKIQYALDISANLVTADRMDAWNMYTKLSSASDSAWALQYSNILRTAGSGSTQPQYDVSLNQIYADYNNVDVKFVATRSLYLDQANFDKQVETIGAGVFDTKQALVTKLPDVLPLVDASGVTLANTVYNVITGGTQYGTLKANRPSNANGLRITDSNTSAVVDISGNVFDISYNITLTDSVVERSYEIRARYYSVDTPAPTFQYVDSLPVTVTFKNGTSNRPRPVIKSKNYSDSKFTVTYGDCDNAGSWLNSNTALVSNVYVKKTGATDVDVGTNDGSVDISGFNGDNVDIYVQDKFTTTYKVNGTDMSSLVQTVNSQSSLPFYLAANPQIDEASIVVNGTNKVITVKVKNMGTPVLNNAMLVVSQDATIDEGDKGYYNLAYFNNQTNGFQSNVLESNTLDLSGNTLDISGNPLSMTTMSITENNLTGMDKVTTLTFSPINLANANPVNLVLLVRNIIEGSDSCAVANKAISYPS